MTAESLAEEQSESGESADTYQQECKLLRDHNFNETGIRYPAYYVMCHREKQFVRV